MIKKDAKLNIEKAISMLQLILENDWTKSEKESRIEAAFKLSRHYISQAERQLKVNPSGLISKDK
jgi:hypothetical protein